MDSQLTELLAQTLYQEIPLSQGIGIEVVSYNGECLVLRAPLAPNINHKDTAFGGSLHALTTLAGWGLLFLKLHERQMHGKIVIQESSIRYHRPVNTDFEARCCVPSAAALEKCFKTLARHNKARIQLDAAITLDEVPAVSFQGSYVVHH